MEFNHRLDPFLVGLLILNLSMVFFRVPLARAWIRLQRTCAANAQQRQLPKWMGMDPAAWIDESKTTRAFLWMGIGNCVGILAARLWLVPFLGPDWNG
jgi:hypothetical protein